MKIIKNSIKYLFIALMLIISALSFSACSQVRVMTITNEDGSIDEVVGVSLNIEDIVSSDYDINEIKNDIMINSQAQAQEMKDELNAKIFRDLIIVRDEESVEILNSYKNGISVIKSDWSDNYYAIGIRFKNIDVYRYYYEIKENVNIEMKTEKHFFYNKVYYHANTMYVKHHNLYNKINEYYSLKYPDLIESENNQLLYTYKTELRRQHSDADYITKQDGEYYHTWVVDPENVDEPIMLYYNVANPENWIIISICITFGVTVVLAIIGVIINLTKKKTKEQE